MRKVNERPFSDCIAGVLCNSLYLIKLSTLFRCMNVAACYSIFMIGNSLVCFLRFLADGCQPGFAFFRERVTAARFFFYSRWGEGAVWRCYRSVWQ